MAGRRPPRGGGEGLLRPTPRPKGVLALDDMIAALVELDANGLCLRWRNHLGGTPPAHLPRWLLMKILAYRIQATAFGGLDKETLRVPHSTSLDPCLPEPVHLLAAAAALGLQMISKRTRQEFGLRIVA
jgi:hypothetical protein